MLAPARCNVAACEMQIAAQIVCLGEGLVVAACVRERLCLGKRPEGVVDLCNQPVGRRAAQQRATAVCGGVSHFQCPKIGFQGIGASSRILMQVPEQNGELERIAFVGGDREAASCERDGLILAEQAHLRTGGLDVSTGRLTVSCAVEVFGPQHGIIDEDRGGGTVELSPFRVRERTVDALAY